MSKKQFLIGVLFASILGSLFALMGYQYFVDQRKGSNGYAEPNKPVYFAKYAQDSSYVVPEGLNFVNAAELARPAVVHIKSTVTTNSNPRGANPNEDFFREFFGFPPDQQGQPRQGQASGSGVIISNDGYIVTNFHVIEHAENIEVTLDDNRTFEAKLIGKDESTDLAVIKVEESNLPFLAFGNSDKVRVGEWVLAVGNPFELTSTVTAGIVSAKARNINILRNRQYGIESFIQTDAAVNPGNSGGALVDLKGNLIGINTAIATPTGSYAGYSFAVPSSIVEKVTSDLMEFGVVQRALLGISIRNVDAELAESEDLDAVSGVYVMGVNEGSAADEAGIKEGDVITAINKVKVSNVAELQAQVAVNRPGDKVKVTYLRDGNTETTYATLKNFMGDTQIVKNEASATVEGATFADADQEILNKYDIVGGVQIVDIKSGKWKDVGIKENFIITAVNKRSVKSVDELLRAIQSREGGMLIEGIYPDGERAFYAIGW